MIESKTKLTDRLRREGRWLEASKKMDVLRPEFRAQGMKREEAVQAAWDAIEQAYPPLPVEEKPPEPVATPKTVKTSRIPWDDLPTEGDFNAEVRWVHQQYILIIEETARGRVIHWDRATTKPPSTGACSLLQWAADNRTAFYKDLLPKTLAAAEAEGDDEGQVREEKRSIAEIQAILERMEAER